MNLDFFCDSSTCHKLNIPNAECTLYPHFFEPSDSNDYLHKLKNNIEWKQEKIIMFGKELDVPRLTAWYGEADLSYIYSGIRSTTIPWIPPLLTIKSKIESILDTEFNSVLINLYRDGSDSVDWHSDDEPELGVNPVIASVSFGEPRLFQMRNKTDKTLKQSILLPHGSLLLMSGNTQANWMHKISKSARKMEPRINLTFRKIVD